MVYGALASAWGGFKNGQIPEIYLSVIPTTYQGRTVITFGPLGPQKLRTEGIAGLLAMADAFTTKFGRPLVVYEGYRDLARQQQLYNGWAKKLPGYNLAAAPSTSPHGWGGSIDIESGIDSYGTPQKAWADANAAAYGYEATGNTFSPREAWHYDIQAAYTAGPTQSAPQEDDMPKLIRNYDGSIGMLTADGTLQPMSSMDEVNALKSTGLVGDWWQAPDGLVWNLLTARTARIVALQDPGVDEARVAAALAPLLVGPILSQLQAAVPALTQAQVEAAAEAAIKDVFAAAAK